MAQARRRRTDGGAGATSVSGDRASLYQEVTDRIVTELEAGRAPWVQPWDSAQAGLGLPANAVTGRHYSGINILILWAAVIGKAYPSQSWLTFRQALGLGGAVRKGERGTTIVFADRFIPGDERERARRDGDGEAEKETRQRRVSRTNEAIPFLKRFTVFNVAQCEGLPESAAPSAPPVREREIVPRAEALMQATGAHIRSSGGAAFYSPGLDAVQVPPQSAFLQQIDYYRTCFHELGHWTGHPSRLNRDMSGRFGSSPYAREELVAEIASAFVCASLDIVPTVRHADYLANWLGVLREDNRAIFRAASQASKASDFILAFDQGVRGDAEPVAA